MEERRSKRRQFVVQATTQLGGAATLCAQLSVERKHDLAEGVDGGEQWVGVGLTFRFVDLNGFGLRVRDGVRLRIRLNRRLGRYIERRVIRFEIEQRLE